MVNDEGKENWRNLQELLNLYGCHKLLLLGQFKEELGITYCRIKNLLRPLACRDCGYESRRGMDVCLSVSCECYVLSGRGLCVVPIPRPESYRMCVCVIDCDPGSTVTLYTYNE
jgi:hypothetical protein